MDEQHTDEQVAESGVKRRRGRALAAALAVVAALAAVPVGVALAGDSDGSSNAGATPAQSTTPDDGRQDRGQGNRGDCPEKNRQGGQDSVQL